MGLRGLSINERNTAFHQVFGKTLPYDKIMLSGGLGAGNRPFTIPDIGMPGRYIIHIGTDKHWSSRKPSDYYKTLIHELTHVWQGYNSWFAWGYTLDSAWSQVHKQGNAYLYSKQWLDWDDYNVEQQAQIVEDWYAAGCSTTDPRWKYIRDNIRNP